MQGVTNYGSTYNKIQLHCFLLESVLLVLSANFMNDEIPQTNKLVPFFEFFDDFIFSTTNEAVHQVCQDLYRTPLGTTG